MKPEPFRLVDFGKALLDLFLPPSCGGCGEPLASGMLCEICASQIEKIGSPRCPRCALPFDGVGSDHLCGECIVSTPLFRTTAAAFLYYGPIADGLRALKYGPSPERISPLSQLWSECCPPLPDVDLAVPVPIHRRKLRLRGFNQTVLLARPLLRDRGLVLHPTAMVRLGDGLQPPQAELSGSRRRAAPRGSYGVTTKGREAITGKRVLLLDDVMTTGATCRECARVLLDSGAEEVHLAVMARTGRG